MTPSFTHYRILRSLGEGAMGQVYLAEDLRLKRQVALKLLPEALAADPARRARFQREAEILASLRHPGIVAVHSVEHEQGHDFITMEVVDGRPLGELIGPQGLTLGRFLDLALPIAKALAAAHGKGIVHRDLKPDNVMVTADGRPKVLDFGVARRDTPTPGVAVGAAASELTATADQSLLTLQGHVVGTLAYMSPEQVEGRPIDSRADLFSLGVVFHEMLTGKRPFPGSSWSAVAAAILRDQPPPVTALKPELPARLGRIVSRLLEKDPDRRYQAALDLAHDLEELRVSGDPAVPAGATRPRSTRRRLVDTLLGAALASAIAGWALRPVPVPAVTGLRPITSTDGLELFPALSPDGKLIAYSAGRPFRLFVRQLDGGHSVPVADDIPGDHIRPQWSPDGQQIAFECWGTEGSTVWLVRALGGPARQLEANAVGPTWSPDGRELAFAHPDGIYARPAEGGEARLVTRTAEPASGLSWSPDGAWIAYASLNSPYLGARIPGNGGGSAIALVPAGGGAIRELTDIRKLHSAPVWAPGGRSIYYASDQGGSVDLYRLRIGRDGSPDGAPARLTTGLSLHTVSLSSDGRRLVASQLPAGSNLWSVPIPPPGQPPSSVRDAHQVTFGPQKVEAASLSRDGKFLVYDSNLAGNFDIFRMPLPGGEPQPLTRHQANDFDPSLSPDGKWVVFYSSRRKPYEMWVVSAEGGPAQPTLPDGWGGTCPEWSPDGTGFVFSGRGPADSRGAVILVTRSADGESWLPPVALPGAETCANWAPDGRSFAYVSSSEVRVRTLQGEERTVVRVGDGFADGARFSPTGDEIYYRADLAGVPAVWAVSSAGGEPRQVLVFDDPARRPNHLDIAVDAGHIYFTLPDPGGDLWLLDLAEGS